MNPKIKYLMCAFNKHTYSSSSLMFQRHFQSNLIQIFYHRLFFSHFCLNDFFVFQFHFQAHQGIFIQIFFFPSPELRNVHTMFIILMKHFSTIISLCLFLLMSRREEKNINEIVLKEQKVVEKNIIIFLFPEFVIV